MQIGAQSEVVSSPSCMTAEEKRFDMAGNVSWQQLWRMPVRLSLNAVMLSFAFAFGTCGPAPVRAAEITIFLNQATASGVRELAAGFEKTTGHKVNVSFQAGPALNQKIVSGAPGDLVSLGLEQFDDYISGGKVVAGSVVEYARVGNGVAVKAGAPKPDISTPEAFKRAMLDAKSIGHTNAGTGPFNTRLFRRLGIYDQIKDKIKIIQGRLVAAAVAAGDVEIGIQQTNVIQPVAGTEYLGPLPAELMEYGRVGVGLLAVSQQREVATAFITFMADPANAALIRKGDMEPPER
jgi:molybdate transport system substrate-binding protein